ncbi:MAG TPA: aminodeoxychorismate synthase component I [Burkholderiaceae bacterium]|nr:aminodeoxychorismate synthase component I [Burkholderiaceae bacterium]
MRCLVVDNYDSFTWNLADYVAQTFGAEPLVVRNDEGTWEQVLARGPFEAIVVSPGPGSVTNPADFNLSRNALEQDEVPVLGVCLGFQGLAYVYGGTIRHAPVPFHGRRSTICHDGDDLFAGLPPEFEAVRYHSLVVASETLPPSLHVTARTRCGLLMGLRHATLPKWGIQFHPESILTEHGLQMIANFRDLARRHTGLTPPRVAAPRQAPATAGRTRATRRVLVRALAGMPAPEAVFLALFARERHAFWLDSQTLRDGLARYSFMGCAGAGDVLQHRVGTLPSQAADSAYLQALDQALEAPQVVGGDELPFEFRGGYVGYMGYEMKSAFGARTSHASTVPDSLWIRADRFVAFDQAEGRAWLVAVADDAGRPDAEAWLDTTAQRIAAVRPAEPVPAGLGVDAVQVRLDLGRDDYLAATDRCKELIVDGESYEICLTNGFTIDAAVDPVQLYRVMRRENAAPFGALIHSGDTWVLSTSPERLLKVTADGCVQAKPIKGTCARSPDPRADREAAERLAASEKDQAENLMIVDLMRNDLGHVSVPGSVHVPKLMAIESFQTVHHMVSTVASRLKPDCTLVDLLHAAFPGGSISGAPKVRTLEIIDQLEPGARGVYCGAIGYLGYNRIADLNVAIRTVSYNGRRLRFGAGGAITFLSDPQGEFDEMLLKAEAVLRPIWHYLGRADSPLRYRLTGVRLSLQEPATSELAQ